MRRHRWSQCEQVKLHSERGWERETCKSHFHAIDHHIFHHNAKLKGNIIYQSPRSLACRRVVRWHIPWCGTPMSPLGHLNCNEKRSFRTAKLLSFQWRCLARNLYYGILNIYNCCYRFIYSCSVPTTTRCVREWFPWHGHIRRHNNRITDDEGRCDQNKCTHCFACKMIMLPSSHHYIARQQWRWKENQLLVNHGGCLHSCPRHSETHRVNYT